MRQSFRAPLRRISWWCTVCVTGFTGKGKVGESRECNSCRTNMISLGTESVGEEALRQRRAQAKTRRLKPDAFVIALAQNPYRHP